MKKVVSGLLALLLIAAIPILTTIKVKAASPDIYYEWNFNGNLNEENGANALTLSDKSTSGGYQFTNDGTIALSLGSTDFILEKPFTVTNELDWSIEWRGKTTDVCALFGAQSKATPYFYMAYAVAGYANSFRLVDDANKPIHIPYGEKASKNTEMHTWKLVNNPFTKKLALYMDEVLVGNTKTPSYSCTFTTMFGRFNDAGAGRYGGEVDFIKVSIKEPDANGVDYKEIKTDYYYEWNFNGNLNEGSGSNNLTPSIYSVPGGYSFSNNGTIVLQYKTTSFTLEKPFYLGSDVEWTIEWRGLITDNSTLFGAEVCRLPFIYICPWVAGYGNSFRIADTSGNVIQLPYGTNANDNYDMHTWKVSNDPVTHTVRLFMDDNEISSLEKEFYTMYITHLFGQFDLAGSVNYGGEIDYIKVWTQTKEIVDVNQQSTETTVPEVTTKAPTTSAPITTTVPVATNVPVTETPVTDTTPGITSVPETEAPKKSGCGSAISVFTLVAAVLASAAVIKKR